MFLGARILSAGPGPGEDFWFERAAAARSSAGVSVSATSAMSSTVVNRCVQLLSATIGKLPVKVRRREDKSEAPDQPIARLLARRPNPWQTPFHWRQMQLAHVLLRGNAYSRMVFDARGQITALVPLNPDGMTPELLAGGNWRWKYRPPGQGDAMTLLREEVLHLKGFTLDMILGLSPIEAQSEPIGAALAAQRYASRVFANDARPGGGFISIPGKFRDAEARRKFREEYQASQTGANAHKTPVFEGGMTYTAIGMKNTDAQLIEARKYSDTDLCRIYGVPPHKVGVMDRATYSNMEQQNVEFFEEIHAWATNFEQAFESQLFTETEADALYVQFELKGVMRADSQARSQFYGAAIKDGWMTRNEAREREDMEALPGLDKPLEPLNMAPAGQRDSAVAPASPVDRQRALLDRAAARAVTREVRAVNKIVERTARGQQVAAVREFYAAHAAYLADCLACDPAAATAWCEARMAELLGNDYRHVLADWETDGADALEGLMT
jgi:HK97 family phage portal protein